MKQDQWAIPGWTHGPLGAPTAGGLLFLAAMLGSRWLLLAGTVLLGAWLVDAAALAWSGTTLLEGCPRVVRGAVGEVVTTDVEVAELRGRPSLSTRIEVGSATVRSRPLAVEPVGPRGRQGARLALELTARGVEDALVVTLLRRGPLGLAISRVRLTVSCDLVVMPAPALPLELAMWGTTEQGEAVPTPGGTDLVGLREWRTGDRSRDISWRATARRGGAPVVVERGEPRSPAIHVLLHGPAPIPGGDPDWEPLLARVAATVTAAQQQGRGFSLRWASATGEPVVAEGTPDLVLRAIAGLPPAEVSLGAPGPRREGELSVATPQAQAYGADAVLVVGR